MGARPWSSLFSSCSSFVASHPQRLAAWQHRPAVLRCPVVGERLVVALELGGLLGAALVIELVGGAVATAAVAVEPVDEIEEGGGERVRRPALRLPDRHGLRRAIWAGFADHPPEDAMVLGGRPPLEREQRVAPSQLPLQGSA